jgi:hypothetical protein
MKITFSAHGDKNQVAGAFELVSAYAASNFQSPDDDELETMLEGMELLDYDIEVIE